jgi:hypothetical protein
MGNRASPGVWFFGRLSGSSAPAVGYGFVMGVLAVARAGSVAGYVWLATRQRPGIHGSPDAVGKAPVRPPAREVR